MKQIEIDQTIISSKHYRLNKSICYLSPRYRKEITVIAPYTSDGATGAMDIVSAGWWVHDWICQYWKFDDGTPINKIMASTILSDILKSEGRWFRARTWFMATLLCGPNPKKE